MFRVLDDDGKPIAGNSNEGHQFGKTLSEDELATRRVFEVALGSVRVTALSRRKSLLLRDLL